MELDPRHLVVVLERKVIELTMENVSLRAQLIALKPVPEVGESENGTR